MKKGIILALTAFILVGMSACKKDSSNNNTAVTDEVEFEYFEYAVIPAAIAQNIALIPAGLAIDAHEGKFETNTEQQLQDKGYTSNQVLSIKGKELKFELTNEPSQNLDFMDTIRIYVNKGDGATADRILFAYKYNYALGQRTLTLDQPNIDVKDIFRSDSVKMTINGTKRAGNHTLIAGTEMKVSAKVVAVVQP
jgi:hypothetical protein